MTAVTTTASPASPTPSATSAAARMGGDRASIRGSGLLLAGQGLSKLANFAAHVLIVRVLSQASFGAFAYALALAQLGARLADFGLHRAVSRFVPIDLEQEHYGRAAGTVVLTACTTLAAGAMAAIALFALAGAGAATTLIDDALAVELLLILVFLTPLEALDRVLIGLLAVLGASRAIFWRRHVLAPALKLAVVGVLIAAGGDARFLAAGYLSAAAIGVLICGMAVSGALHRRGLRHRIGQERMEVPWRELLAFTVPLLASDLVLALMSGADVLFLAWFADSEAIASYRAVLPVAHLNQIVIATFAILYTPQAARLYSRGDGAALNELYWKTAGWIAVLSLPVFLVSVPLAGPLTTLLFGQRYAGSAEILMLLSLGSFFHAALGFNGTTLTVYRRVRYVMLLSLAAAGVNIGLNLWLIPHYGALGAAAATCVSMLVHNVLKQAGLRSTGVRLIDPRAARLYAWIAIVSGGLFGAHKLMAVPPAVSVGLAAVGFIVVLRANRRLLDIDGTFPELRRLPLIARLVR